MIDPDGFRPNVGIILSNPQGQLLWARRIGQNAWQFPQGGTRGWLRYRLPRQFIRRKSHPVCIGQKQVWFMLRMLCADQDVCLDQTENPEFDRWRWVDYWHPLNEVVAFKRNVYKKALRELAPLVFPEGAPRPGSK